MHTTQAPSAGVIEVKGVRLERARVLGVETKPAESCARNLCFFIAACLGPIAAMVAFSCLHGTTMWIVGLACAGGVPLSLIVAAAWKKPWGVVVEEPDRYRCVYMTSDKADADAVAAQVQAAL